MNKIDLSLRIATAAHAGQTDKNGEPYILHPLAVGLMGQTDEERMAGFLHDVVEDTPWTFDQLLEAGIPVGVVGALRLLTHEPTEEKLPPEQALARYHAYVQHIIGSGNPIALAVKRNDLTHNLSRANSNEWFQKKYLPALQMVEQAIEERSAVSLYTPAPGAEVAFFACGCFWGVQHHFERCQGVSRTLVGYTGGQKPQPTYSAVRHGLTGHFEAVAVEFDPEKVSYRELCQLFFEIHDPAQTDGQGSDIGAQYRSAIFFRTAEQQATAEAVIADLRSRGHEVNTRLLPATTFWTAEATHQHYYAHTGGQPYCHIRVKKFPK